MKRMRRGLIFACGCLLTFAFSSNVGAIEKLKFGTSTKEAPNHYLPVLAGEEKGFWKENSIDLEWVPFRGGAPLNQAMAAGHLAIGIGGATGVIPAQAQGLPVIMVGQLFAENLFGFWVRPESRFKQPSDLKGAKIGVHRFQTVVHIYAQIVVKSLGLERDVRFVSTGGVPETIAASKAGVVDVVPFTPMELMELEVRGELRPLLRVADYLPKDWTDSTIFVRKDFAKRSPDSMRRLLKGLFQATAYIKENPAWTIAKMRSESGYSEEAAKRTYKVLKFASEPRIDPKALENVRSFLIDWRIVPRDKMPPVGELYTPEFAG